MTAPFRCKENKGRDKFPPLLITEGMLICYFSISLRLWQGLDEQVFVINAADGIVTL